MANIDTSTIEGFDGMTADEKVTALLSFQIPDPVDLSGYVKKDVFDTKATEAARKAAENENDRGGYRRRDAFHDTSRVGGAQAKLLCRIQRPNRRGSGVHRLQGRKDGGR